ncbi:putative reverse transcriptase zinc-binding domain-containing protein [Helianthus annuus]|uniref:Reverse transcriptase zinc-binding domain-containing protein n=1 Tax=Helianthus annuus TaxID=4232 RepID=A0A9K3JPH1_HELAN|nr:putative reverse transcriptase zinc-binding domain-containing protein [Helianthus annuus]KAJ0605056.1 putative reverse transcriptase zinc-binding domain-containing protein [Helianthus annuus]KAJ0777522.1 putative reverse transcriptase zinc-binding domain-containing protein [Helianthus annuus]
MIKRFLWGGSHVGQKIHWVAWDSVSVPKDFGGLGLCKLIDINLALLSKWCWRFKTEEICLWRRVINAIHCGARNWDFLPARKNLGGPWCKVVKWIARTTVDDVPLRSFFRGIPGKGDRIAFWLDPWISSDPLKNVFPRLFQLEVNRRVKICDRIRDGFGQNKFSWNWKRPLVSALEKDDLSQLVSLLDAFSVSGNLDKWVWLGNGSEDFSVGAVKRVLVKGSGSEIGPGFSWCNWIPAKCNVFAWRANLGRIPTVEALRRRNITISDSRCGLCNNGEDSVSHLFTECYVANFVWSAISSWCKVPHIFAFSFQDLMIVHEYYGLKDPEKTILQGVIIIACWCIWKARN